MMPLFNDSALIPPSQKLALSKFSLIIQIPLNISVI
jgi:hypothetical protein